MKKIIFIALCFVASFKANSQVTIDTTLKDCIAAKLKTKFVIPGVEIKKDTATHFAFIEDKSTVDKWYVTVSLRNKNENFILRTLDLTRKDFDNWDGNKESLLKNLLIKFNEIFGLNLQF